MVEEKLKNDELSNITGGEAFDKNKLKLRYVIVYISTKNIKCVEKSEPMDKLQVEKKLATRIEELLKDGCEILEKEIIPA